MKSAYISSEVAGRIKAELDRRGLKPSPTMKSIGLGENTLHNFKSSMPKADTLAVIADFLNVSVDYLLGRNAVPASAPVSGSRLNKMIALFCQLSPEQQDLLIANAEMFIGSNPISKTGTDFV